MADGGVGLDTDRMDDDEHGGCVCDDDGGMQAVGDEPNVCHVLSGAPAGRDRRQGVRAGRSVPLASPMCTHWVGWLITYIRPHELFPCGHCAGIWFFVICGFPEFVPGQR